MTDTIPPDPPAGTAIYGPAEACTGEVSVYYTFVPIDCQCQWAVNGIIQPGSSSSLAVEWTAPGNYIVSVVFISSGGQYSEPMVTLVSVHYFPEVNLGNDTTILQGETVILNAGNPGSDYLWSTGETTQTILVSQSGSYSVSVNNFCGSDSDTIEVFVYVGMPEWLPDSDCFTATAAENEIVISRLRDNMTGIQVISMNGEIVYSGIPKKTISIKNSGIYLIRGISAKGTCNKKVFVP